MNQDDMYRFFGKVSLLNPNGCWEWQGYKSPYGYGQFRLGGSMRKAHRVSYSIEYGEFEDSLLVCHTCDNPPCVNPSHLFLGTHQDNADDKMSKNRHSGKSKTHCYNGHLLDQDNTYLHDSKRHCRMCRRAADARRRERARSLKVMVR